MKRPSIFAIGILLVTSVTAAIRSTTSTLRASPSAPVTLLTATCQNANSNYWAYNRYTWNDIDGTGGIITCGAACHAVSVPGLFPITAGKKASYRFTLPSTASTPSVSAVWLYYRTVGSPGNYQVSVYDDSTGRPGTSLGSASFTPLATGTTGWQSTSISLSSSLTPGGVYHIVVEPGASGTFNTHHNITLIATRTKCPVPYVPTDGPGTAIDSPFDSSIAVMMAPGSPNETNYLVQGDTNEGFDPIFALDLGANGIIGQPYDQHLEQMIGGGSEWGQRLTLSSAQDLNYVSFFVRAAGCNPCSGGPPATPTGDLTLKIYDSSTPPAVVATIQLIPGSYGGPTYRGRSHWFGKAFSTVSLAASTYTFVLSSPASAGTGTDGWIASIESSTLPVGAASVPTYGRDSSYAVSSTNGPPFTAYRKQDMGFIFGYFGSGGLTTPLAILDDSGITTDCGGTVATQFVHTAPNGTVIDFSQINRNIGAAVADPGASPSTALYMRLLDTSCNQVVAPNASTTSTPVNQDGYTALSYTMTSSDAFLLLELGHYDNGNTIIDDLIPWEIRVGTCP